MSFVDIEGPEQRNILDTLYQAPPDPTAFDPGFVRAGDIVEPLKGAGMAITKASLFAADAFTPLLLGPARSIDALLGGDDSEKFLLNEQQKLRDHIKLLRPDPVNTGLVGNVLNSVVDVGGTALIGTALSLGDPAGGAALVGVTNAYSSYVEGTEELGLDPKTAAMRAGIEGGTLALGVRLPAAFGPNVLKNTLLYGPGVNTVLGVAQRGATSELLRENGYGEQADQYQWLDSQAMIIDAVLGSAFGYIGAKSHIKLNRDMLPSDIDTALSGNKTYHMEVDSAPGVPTDELSRQSHVEAMGKSIDDLLNDRPVDVESTVRNTEFIQRRDSDTTPREIKEALDTLGQGHLMDDLVPGKKVESMTLDEMRRELLRDPLTGIGNRRAFEEAEKLPVRGSIDADGLKWINDNLGHDAGDQMLKTIGRALSQETKQAYRIGGDEFAVQARTMEEAEAALQRATQRLENAVIKVKTPDGGTVEVKGVKLSYGIGKTSNEAEARLQSHKLERERAGLRTPRGSEPSGITRTPSKGQQGDPGGTTAEGTVSQRIGNAVNRVREVLTGKKPETNQPKTADGDFEAIVALNPSKVKTRSQLVDEFNQSQHVTDTSVKVKEESPEVTAAEQALAEHPDIEIQTETGLVRASDLMARADEEIATAKKESSAFKVAVNCFLRYGS